VAAPHIGGNIIALRGVRVPIGLFGAGRRRRLVVCLGRLCTIRGCRGGDHIVVQIHVFATEVVLPPKHPFTPALVDNHATKYRQQQSLPTIVTDRRRPTPPNRNPNRPRGGTRPPQYSNYVTKSLTWAKS
jgi:hypothetical protein